MAPVCPGRHFRRIPVPCPWADSGTRSTNCGENSWSQHTNKGDRVSAADLGWPGIDLSPCCAELAPAPWAVGMGLCFMGSLEHIRVRARRETICPSQPREEDPCENEQPPVVTCLLCAGLRSQDFRATAPCVLPAASMSWFYRGACGEAGTPAWGRAHTSHSLGCGCQPAFCSCLWAFQKLCPSGSTHILLLDTEHS